MSPLTFIKAPSVKPPVAMLGVAFDNITMDGAIQRVVGMIASGRPHYLVTANVDFLVQARRDVELRRILFDADLVLCDGTPLVWTARLFGNRLPERVAGSDLVPALMQVAAERNYRVFFLGSTPQAARFAVERMVRQYPQLPAPAWYSPPFSRLLEMDHDEIRRRIVEFRPDLLLVSFGCPKQEKWIAMHYRSLGVPVSIGVGATIDFLAGHVRRAPVWMRRSGTEWIFRLIQEPRRLFRRYACDLGIFTRWSAAQWLRLRPRRRRWNQVQRKWHLQGDAACRTLLLAGPLDLRAVLDLASVFEPGSAGSEWLVDLSGVTGIDSTGLAMLMRWQRDTRAASGALVLINPSRQVDRALRLMRLQDFFYIARDIEVARELLARRREANTTRATAGSSPPRNPRSVVAGPTVLSWPEEVTAANAARVWDDTVLNLAVQVEADQWWIDLSEVRFIDSTGADLLRRADRLARSYGATLGFIGVSPGVRNVLDMANLNDILARPAGRSGWTAPLIRRRTTATTIPTAGVLSGR